MAGFNNVVLMGYVQKDPEVREYGEDDKKKKIAKYTLAVPKNFGQGSNYIFCQAFGKNADFVEKYLNQGMQILLHGELTTSSYEKNGKTYFTWGVTVAKHIFTGAKEDSIINNKKADNGFIDIPDTIDSINDTNLPFDY